MFFFFFTRPNLRARKIGRVSEVLCARARPMPIGLSICPICPCLSMYESPSFSLIFKEIIYKIIPNNCRTEGKEYLKGTLSCLRQYLANESLLKMTENTFYFTLKALVVLKIFTFLS